ncbi:hypothetical protein [Pseudomonas umsongensis]|jgi:hypothetical protein|uniref:hypothetical protein n=1 Tax=Pseudomonas umsongensis TaxID=198618 RepID=UPI00200ADA39|nr:hypothetical protein [Pseudomonas umsongensis]MCK8687398.1 hypothetical protein [Pseudomonas umsongensis]
MSKADAVDRLIRAVKECSKGSGAHLAALEGLGEAGGNAAIDQLIVSVNEASVGSGSHLAALKALGRAARNE